MLLDAKSARGWAIDILAYPGVVDRVARALLIVQVETLEWAASECRGLTAEYIGEKAEGTRAEIAKLGGADAR